MNLTSDPPAWAAARRLYVQDPDMEVFEFEALLDHPDRLPQLYSAGMPPPPQFVRVDVTSGRSLAHDVFYTLVMIAVIVIGFGLAIYAIVT